VELTSRLDLRLMEWGPPVLVRAAQAQRPEVQRILEAHLNAGVLDLVEVKGGVVVSARGIVGSAHAPGVSITIAPRDPVLFREMRLFVSQHRDKDVTLRGLEGTGSDPLEEAAAAFERATTELISNGIPIEYGRDRVTTSNPAGEWDISATVAEFASHGIHHKVVEWRPTKQIDTDLVGVLMAGGEAWRERQFERGGSTWELDELLEAIIPPDAALTRDTQTLLDRAEEKFSGRRDVLRLVAAVRALVSSDELLKSMEGASHETRSTYFFTDRLWERVVLTLCRAAARSGQSVRFHPLRSQGLTLFDDGGPSLDPDVLLYSDAGVAGVVDAKFSFASTWSADDVYQITAYADRLNAPMALLVYVSGSEEWWEEIGASSSGARIYACGIASAQLSRSAAKTARNIRLVV
jgi:hypothetical protein